MFIFDAHLDLMKESGAQASKSGRLEEYARPDCATELVGEDKAVSRADPAEPTQVRSVRFGGRASIKLPG